MDFYWFVCTLQPFTGFNRAELYMRYKVLIVCEVIAYSPLTVRLKISAKPPSSKPKFPYSPGRLMDPS